MTSPERAGKARRFSGLDAGLGPARPLARADAQWLVEQVVTRALEPEHTLRPRQLSLRAVSLVAIAVVTSAAAATIVHQKFGESADANAPTVSAPQRPNSKATSGVAPKRAASEPSAQTTASTDIRAPQREAKTLATGPSSSGSRADAATAVDELSAANALRRKAQWQAAEAAYRAIAARFPSAPEATAAQLAAAELRLEHLGDAAGALRLYQAVPRSSALGVEALFGVSRAQRALGDSVAEAATLRSLLDTYPTSLQADAARSRVKQLATESVNH